jgi:hypothetical protein
MRFRGRVLSAFFKRVTSSAAKTTGKMLNLRASGFKTCMNGWQIPRQARSTSTNVCHAYYSFGVLLLRIRALRAKVKRRGEMSVICCLAGECLPEGATWTQGSLLCALFFYSAPSAPSALPRPVAAARPSSPHRLCACSAQLFLIASPFSLRTAMLARQGYGGESTAIQRRRKLEVRATSFQHLPLSLSLVVSRSATSTSLLLHPQRSGSPNYSPWGRL